MSVKLYRHPKYGCINQFVAVATIRGARVALTADGAKNTYDAMCAMVRLFSRDAPPGYTWWMDAMDTKDTYDAFWFGDDHDSALLKIMGDKAEKVYMKFSLSIA